MLDAGLDEWAKDGHAWLSHRLAPRFGDSWEREVSHDRRPLDAAGMAKALEQPPAILSGHVKGNQSAAARSVRRFRNELYHRPIRPHPEEELHVGTARQHLRTLLEAAQAFSFPSVATFKDLLAHLKLLEEQPVVSPDRSLAENEQLRRERDDALAALELAQEDVERERSAAATERAELEQERARLSAEKSDDRQRLIDLEATSERLRLELCEREARGEALAADAAFVRRQLAAAEELSTPSTPSASPGRAAAERWRLSSTRRSMTRLVDGVDLADVVGEVQAARHIDDFLRSRPEGGRVWVDSVGNATTLVGGRPVALGRVGNPEPLNLSEAIHRELRLAPGSTAREIVHALRGTTWATDKKVVNSVLYSGTGTDVRKDDSTRPRWFALDGRGVVPAPAGRRGRVREAAEQVTALQQLNTALLASAPTVQQHTPRAAVPIPSSWGLSLHTWQIDALHAWHDEGCQGVVEAVTGSGKTHLGLAAALRAHEEGIPTTVLVPSIDLQRQWVRRFAEHAPALTVATVGGAPRGDVASADVVVAVVNSAVTNDLVRGEVGDLLIADEVHRYGASTWSGALRAGYARRLGLTATLERGDDAVDSVIRPFFGPTITTYSFAHALRDEVVAPFQLLLLPVALTDEEQEQYDRHSRKLSDAVRRLRTGGALSRGGPATLAQRLRILAGAGGQIGRAAQAAESAIRQRQTLLAGIEGKLAAIEELAERIDSSRGTVVFTQTRETAKEVAHRLRALDVPAAALHSGVDDRERAQNLEALATGSMAALSAPKLLDEGTDIPTVDLGIVTSASRSTRQMVQRLGRVVRRKDDGRSIDFVILFAAGTVEDPEDGAHEGFFGLVTDAASSIRRLGLGWTAMDLTAER